MQVRLIRTRLLTPVYSSGNHILSPRVESSNTSYVFDVQYIIQQSSTFPDHQISDRLGLTGKFVENSTKLTCLEIIGYRIKYSKVLWLLQLQIRCGRKFYKQAHSVNSNSLTLNCLCSPLPKENPIIPIFCISGWLAVPINPDKWSPTVIKYRNNFTFSSYPIRISSEWPCPRCPLSLNSHSL